MLKITDYSVKFSGREILHQLNLEVPAAGLSVLMGPNGSGKSTLGFALLSKPGYTEISGRATLNGKTLGKTPFERSRAGLFLAFQNPVAVPGVGFANFLRQSVNARLKSPIAPGEFYERLCKEAKLLSVPEEFLGRNLNEEFSGGEKKRMEMLQALVLGPKYAILDEPDTGTDVDSLKLVAKAVNILIKRGTGVLLITHYQRLLSYLTPKKVYVLVNGRLAAAGGAELIAKIEDKGYGQFK